MHVDDSESASAIRLRYHMGGSAKDNELSSGQIRARYGIPSKTVQPVGPFDLFSRIKPLSGDRILLILMAATVVLLVAFFKSLSS